MASRDAHRERVAYPRKTPSGLTKSRSPDLRRKPTPRLSRPGSDVEFVEFELVADDELPTDMDSLVPPVPLSEVERSDEVKPPMSPAAAESSLPYRRVRRAKWVQAAARSGPPYGPDPSTRPEDVDGLSGPEWCTIVLARRQRAGEFRLVRLERNGQRRVIARSASFSMPRSSRIRKRGAARAAYGSLVRELLAGGWRPLHARGRWHDTAFIRYSHGRGH
jgi:hypothetical protein